MVGHVMRFMLKAVWAATFCVPAWALGPMAPFVAPQADQAGAFDPAAGAGLDAQTPTQGLSGVRLGRYAGAVVDGQWIRKGRTVRGARLVQVQRTRVVLKHPDGHTEIIEMYPPLGGQAGTAVPATTEAIKP
jgi:hypothetical protein